MKLRTLEAIINALESASGPQRDNLLRALNALSGLGYRPVVPVDIEEFADPEKRKEWMNPLTSGSSHHADRHEAGGEPIA